MANTTPVEFFQVKDVMTGYAFPMILETFIYGLCRTMLSTDLASSITATALYTVLNVTLVYRRW